MLRELHIQNLAVIEDLAIELGAGLNCFTGQTGAGKSLILGAFEILLGLKQGTDMIRPGADEARVRGMFEIHDGQIALQISELLDTKVEQGEDLLITRKLFSSGRSSVSVNGQPATAAMVRAVGELLVDIHGQHDHQFLLKPSNQLMILDSFGKSLEWREEFAGLHAKLRTLLQRKQELQASSDLRKQQLELYEFQAGEIDDAQLIAGEFEELRQRHALLSNLEKVKRDAGQASSALYESEGAVVERLQMIAHILSELTLLDPGLESISEQIKTATLGLQEVAFDLNRYVERLELDPGEVAQIEERLNIVNRMISKYGAARLGGTTDPVADVLALREELGRKIEALRSADVDMKTIDADTAAARTAMQEVGAKLTAARKTAAGKIKPLIEGQIRELGMVDAKFDVEFVPVEDNSSPSGMETIEMLVCTNPGQPSRPLRKIASGGELSRIMLGLKSVLAQSDRVSVLVFDEIDSNIGGRMGTVIGRKLSELARRGSTGSSRGSEKKAKQMAGKSQHQVLCITHLPQIAAFADRHFRIAKAVEGSGTGKATRTTVTVLDGDERIEELAEMLTGKNVTETTRKQVKEMMESGGR